MTNPIFSTMRAAMVASQLRTNAVIDPVLLQRFETVERETFVPEAFKTVAYVDVAIALTPTRMMNTPLATARLIGEARLRGVDRVLVIGAATGYSAAVIAPLCASVTAVEDDATLISIARGSLASIANVTVIDTPLSNGYPEGAPYDVIIVDGAIEQFPQTLIDQAAQGARIVCGINDHGVVRLCFGRKSGDSVTMLPFADIGAVALPGFARVREFSF